MPTRVLVVDPNRDFAQAIVALLGLLKYEAQACSDADGCLRIAAAWLPQIVIFDPTAQAVGVDLAARIRELEGLGGAAMIGWSTRRSPDQSDTAGFAAFLAKPIEVDSLRETLEAVTRKQES
jgi:two-component system, OmpR family, response regulator